MDLDDLLSSGRRDGHGKDHHRLGRWPHRDGCDRHGHSRPEHARPDRLSIARELWRIAASRPWMVGAAAGVLVILLTAGLWGVIMVFGYVERHGVKGLVDVALVLAGRLWEGR